MRRIRLLLVLAPLLIFLGGCSLISNLTEGGSSLDHEGDIAEARFVHIVEAIETKDSELLKSLFSEKALAEAEDFDVSVEQLFSLIDEEVVYWERNGGFGSSESWKSGKASICIRTKFYLSTNTDTYALFMLDYSTNTIDPSNEGLYTIRVVRAWDEKTYFITWQDMKIPGIYIPEEYFSEVPALNPEGETQVE